MLGASTAEPAQIQIFSGEPSLCKNRLVQKAMPVDSLNLEDFFEIVNLTYTPLYNLLAGTLSHHGDRLFRSLRQSDAPW